MIFSGYMRFYVIMSCMSVAWACSLDASDSTRFLIKDSLPVSCIVLPDNAGVVEKQAVSELSAYMEKITGANVEIINAPSKEKYNIYIAVMPSADQFLSKKMKSESRKIGDEGYMIAVDSDGVRIIGKTPIGTLYGVYGFLKKYGSVRWFFPGADGEYCPKNKNFAVEDGIIVSNPSFSSRELNLVCVNINSKMTDTWDWMVRNGIQITTRKIRRPELYPAEREKRSDVNVGGGHVFSYLISDKLYDEHPEYFALIDGKRVKQAISGMGDRNQPCTSNPDVFEIMSKKLLEWNDMPPKGGTFLIGNNDGIGWCQCDNCKKLDPAEEKEKKLVSTRYWTLLNGLAENAFRKNPDLKLQGWAYQNFQDPPSGIVPDKRFCVLVCVHGRCYRHAINDEKCAVNGRYFKLLKDWVKLNSVSTYEYTNMLPAGEVLYAPTEHIFANDIKTYKKIGLRGSLIEIAPPDGVFAKGWTDRKIKEMWVSNWWLVYMMSYFLWDVDADYQAVLEDAGSKFYGAAWPAMKQYREKLTKTFEETPGDMIYGTPDIALGKCLEAPNVEFDLLKLLDAAEKAALGEEGLLKKVSREREYFAASWQKMHKVYLEAAKMEIGASKVSGQILLNGKLDDQNWKKADFVTGFVDQNGGSKASVQTFVRMLYDKDNVYLGIESMEPVTGKIKALCTKNEEPVWNDNSVELFISSPALNGKYLHLIVNSKGALYSALSSGMGVADISFKSGVDVKSAVFDDRWIMEAKIPAAALGGIIKDGETWKINVARNRVLTDGTLQRSSLCGGAFHGVDAFRTLAFGDKGIIQNGDFEDAEDAKNYIKWKFSSDKLPLKWIFHDCGGEASLLDGTAASGKKFLRLKSIGNVQAIIFQPLNIKEADILMIRAKVRGKGTVKANMFLYNLETKKYISTASFGEKLTIDSNDWRTFEATYEYDGKTSPSLALYFGSLDGVDIDDVTILRGKNMDGLGNN